MDVSNIKCGVVVFPGSNCDHDCFHILSEVYGLDAEYIWHKDQEMGSYSFIILPGGFSYGDYLRTGAIAKFSPIMRSVVKYANQGGKVLGICNGFQILVESGLLPGALLRNQTQKFICKMLELRVENHQTVFTESCKEKAVLRIPVNHGQGNYFVDSEMLKRLEDNNQIAFRYCNPTGEIDDSVNPNGSISNIAGVTNAGKNVLE